MDTILPDTCFTVLEAGDIQLKTSFQLNQNGFYKSVCDDYTLHEKWWDKTKSILTQTSEISTTTGYSLLIAIHNENGHFNMYSSLFTSCPASFKSFEIWALFQAVQASEFKFLETCSKPNNEVALTSSLLQTLNMKSESIQEKYSKYLSITGAHLNVKKLELQIQNREKYTGGDFALLFEWKDKDGILKICPVVFQAKRVTSLNADISQKNTNTGYQYHTLSKTKCNPTYIFYNCDTQGITKKPRLPVVKKVSDINFSSNLKTSSVDNTLSLSMFILDIVSSDKFYVTESRKKALEEILIGVKEMELSNIITFSVDSSALVQYEKEYKSYLSNKRADDIPKNNNDSF